MSRDFQAEQGRQVGSDLDSFSDRFLRRLPVRVANLPEFDRSAGRMFVCFIRLPGTVQNGVIPDLEQHFTSALNSCFISSLHRSNIFLKNDDVLALKDIGWLRPCYCIGCGKGL